MKSVQRGKYAFLSDNAHQLFDAIWNQLSTVKIYTANVSWYNRSRISELDLYLREILGYGMALVGRSSVCPSITLFVREHFVVHFPSFLQGKISWNILEWSSYMWEGEAYMWKGEECMWEGEAYMWEGETYMWEGEAYMWEGEHPSTVSIYGF